MNWAANLQAAFKKGKWKYIENYETNQPELYDLIKDIGEQKDVSVENSDIVQELRILLSAWRANVGAKPPRMNPKYFSKEQ